METTQVNLCRALKLKNRIASRLSRLDQKIIEHNSSIKDYSEYDVRSLYASRMRLAEQLVQLKVDISTANQPIQKQIFEVAECKSLCHTLTRINTRHGPYSSGMKRFSISLPNFASPTSTKKCGKSKRKSTDFRTNLTSLTLPQRSPSQQCCWNIQTINSLFPNYTRGKPVI